MDNAAIAQREEMIRKFTESEQVQTCRHLASIEGDRLIIEWDMDYPIYAWVTNADCVDQELREYEPCNQNGELKVYDLNLGVEVGKVSRIFVLE